MLDVYDVGQAIAKHALSLINAFILRFYFIFEFENMFIILIKVKLYVLFVNFHTILQGTNKIFFFNFIYNFLKFIIEIKLNKIN